MFRVVCCSLIYANFILQIVYVTPFPNTTVLYKEKLNSNISDIVNHSIVVNDTKITNFDNQQEVFFPESIKTSVLDGTLSSEEEVATISYAFRGPNPVVEKLELPLSEVDKNVREAWGGDCNQESWDKCSKIKTWGRPGGYFMPDKRSNGKLIWINNGTKCDTPEEKFYCLGNGWTVARCHLLCMAQCNKEILFKYDQIVKHEGQCPSPIG